MGAYPRDVDRHVASGRAERCRLAILGHLVELAGDPHVTQAMVRAAAGVGQNCAKAICNGYNAGEMPDVLTPWVPPQRDDDGASPREALAELLGDLTDEGRERSTHEVARLVALGLLDPSEAREIRGPLDSARNSADAARKNSPPPEDPTRFLLASSEALEAARALDLIVDDERRDRVLAIVAAELEADIVACPNVDEGGA